MKTLVLSLSFFCHCTGLFALTVSKEAVDAQLRHATLVADVLITEVENLPHPTLGVENRASAKLLKIYQSEISMGDPLQVEDTVEILSWGGEFKERGAFFSGLPRPRKGLRYRVYLNPLPKSSTKTFTIAGFESGLVPLDPHRAYSRNRTDGSNGQGEGAYLYWESNYFPIPYFVAAPTFKDLPEFIPGIEASFSTWREPNNVLVEFLSMGCSQSTHNENDGINNIILITDNWPFDPAAIAITRNFYIAGEDARAGLILDSDIMLNGVNHSFTVSGENTKHDLQNILTHEIGHFLGLGHEANPTDQDATMFAVASPNETKKRILKASDLEGLRAAYLGIGQKIQGQGTHCAIPKANLGCLAVHDRAFDLKGFPGMALYLVLTLLLGRFITRKEAKRTR